MLRLKVIFLSTTHPDNAFQEELKEAQLGWIHLIYSTSCREGLKRAFFLFQAMQVLWVHKGQPIHACSRQNHLTILVISLKQKQYLENIWMSFVHEYSTYNSPSIILWIYASFQSYFKSMTGPDGQVDPQAWMG